MTLFFSSGSILALWIKLTFYANKTLKSFKIVYFRRIKPEFKNKTYIKFNFWCFWQFWMFFKRFWPCSGSILLISGSFLSFQLYLVYSGSVLALFWLYGVKNIILALSLFSGSIQYFLVLSLFNKNIFWLCS